MLNFNVALLSAKSQGSDKIWRNAALNSRYIINGLLGKEFKLPSRNLTLTVDTKICTMGGYYYTPIDYEKSVSAQQEVKDRTRILSEHYPSQFQWDLRVGFRKDNRKTTHAFYIDMPNVTQHRNVAHYYFIAKAKAIATQYYNYTALPDLLYRVTF